MRVTCVVDNAAKPSSGFWGEHGLAYLIEVGGQRILFDTGQSGTVLDHNLKRLGIDPATIDALAISHAHYDHTGGLPTLLPQLRAGIPLYGNADLFRERYSRGAGMVKSIGMSIGRQELAAQFDLKLSDEPQGITPEVWTTGRIAGRREFSSRSEGHLMAVRGELVADAYQDDMALVLRLEDGLAVLCGCCHAGLLNTLGHVAGIFLQPVALIAGGLHLLEVGEADLQRAVTHLAAMPELQRIYPGHCTGVSAVLAMTRALGSKVVHTSPAGTVIEIQQQLERGQ